MRMTMSISSVEPPSPGRPRRPEPCASLGPAAPRNVLSVSWPYPLRASDRPRNSRTGRSAPLREAHRCSADGGRPQASRVGRDCTGREQNSEWRAKMNFRTTYSMANNALKTLAIPAGFEPATLCLEGRCSIRLSYGTIARYQRRATSHIPPDLNCACEAFLVRR